MTKGTDSRNIKMIIQGIMNKHNIDNLSLEMDLFSAWMRYVNERDEGETPAEARSKIAKEYGILGFVGMSDAVREKARMLEILEGALHLTIDAEEWNDVILFCIRKEAEGQTVVRYQEWRDKDVFNSPKSHQIAQDPKLVIKTWPQAFANKPEAKVPQPTEVPEWKKDVNL